MILSFYIHVSICVCVSVHLCTYWQHPQPQYGLDLTTWSCTSLASIGLMNSATPNNPDAHLHSVFLWFLFSLLSENERKKEKQNKTTKPSFMISYFTVVSCTAVLKTRNCRAEQVVDLETTQLLWKTCIQTHHNSDAVQTVMFQSSR